MERDSGPSLSLSFVAPHSSKEERWAFRIKSWFFGRISWFSDLLPHHLSPVPLWTACLGCFPWIPAYEPGPVRGKMLAGVWGGRGEVVYSLSCPLLVQSLEEAMCSLTMAVVSVP